MEARRSQLTICRSVLADHGFTNPEVFEDLGQSGATTDRPAFQRLMDLIRSKEVRVLAVSDMSGVTRAISD